jgi:hypothetical protein
MEIAAIPLTISNELHALISADHCSIGAFPPELHPVSHLSGREASRPV